MSSRDWKTRITDILKAIEEILELTEGMTPAQFAQDIRTAKAVLYNLAIIGEAARHVPPEVQAAWPALPWREMSDMRNVVIHHYFGVDPDILWETIRQELSPLIPLLREMLK
jgi:uncharacterized protein with HEPN domain